MPAQYFAALPANELAAELQSRIDAYYQWILTTGRLARWRVAYDTYYGQRGSHNSSYVTAGGEKGELSFLMSNEYRNLVQHLLVMAFQSRPSLETVATNTDSKSKAASYIAKGIIEYYRRDGRIDDNTKDATEIALIMDTGWTFNEWDTMLGEDAGADPDTLQVAKRGDIKSRARTPLDVVIDHTKPQGQDRDWILVRDPVNKFDLAARYKDKAEEITKMGRDVLKDALYRFGDNTSLDTSTESADIDVWTFFHRKSPAMPMGRMFQFVTPTLSFFDGPTPYPTKLPGNRICPSEQILSSLGYSNANDLLGLQDVMDALISAAVTNMTACGVNTIWTKSLANWDFEELGKGMSLIESEEKPEVLMLNKLSPEWFSLANFIIQRMQTLSGINSVARGDTGGKDLSGAAMALLQSMSIQFNNGLVRAVNKLIEDNGNDVIKLTQAFAKEARLGMIVGENNKYMMESYSSADIAGIQRVYCRQSNPMKDTTAGKMQLLEKYMQVPGLITGAGQITEVLETGSLDSSTDPGRNAILAMDQENEFLVRGKVPVVVFTDNHPEHMKHLARLFADPKDRMDAQLIARVKEHWEQHKIVWQQTDPATLMALGIPPFPQPMMPPGMVPPGGPEGAPPGAPGPGGPSPIAAPPSDQQPGIPGPGLPQNPMTGEQWDPSTGGLPPA